MELDEKEKRLIISALAFYAKEIGKDIKSIEDEKRQKLLPNDEITNDFLNKSKKKYEEIRVLNSKLSREEGVITF